MPNFNSREVATRILAELESGFYKGLSTYRHEECLDRAESILDSALLDAHPEAGDLVKKLAIILNVHEYFGPGDLLIDNASRLLSVALETSRREERIRIVDWVKDNAVATKRILFGYKDEQVYMVRGDKLKSLIDEEARL